jgi:hypothetical protein
MSKRTVSQPAGSIRSASPSTPHRPVISLALVIFVPALWLVRDGNLSVQTALERFIGALLVSWVAARVVLATVSSFARSATPAETARAPASAGAGNPAGTTGLGAADGAGRPGDAG